MYSKIHLNNNIKDIYGPVVPVAFSSRDRLQSTCPFYYCFKLNIFSLNKKILTSHQHTDFFRYVKLFIIVQTELDTIISFVDHLDKNNLNPYN